MSTSPNDGTPEPGPLPEVIAALAAATPGESVGLLDALTAAHAAGQRLPGAAVLDAVLASTRLIAYAQAHQARWIAAFGRPGMAVPISSVLTALANRADSLLTTDPVQPDPDDFEPDAVWENTKVYGHPIWDGEVVACAARFAAAELSAAMRIAPITAAAKLDTATTLVDRLPATHHALQSGLIDFGHAAVLLDATADSDDAVCAQLESQFLPSHTTADDTAQIDEGVVPDPAAIMTPGQLRTAAEQAVVDVDPGAADRRAAHARSRRGVGVRGLGGDLSRFHADLLSPDAATTFGLLDQLAHDLPTESRHGRGINQLRADIFADLITHLATHGHIDLRSGEDTDELGDPDETLPTTEPPTDAPHPDSPSHGTPPDTDTAEEPAAAAADATQSLRPTPSEEHAENSTSDDTPANEANLSDRPVDQTPPATQKAAAETAPIEDDGGDFEPDYGNGLDYEAWWAARTGAPITLRPGYTCNLDITIGLCTLAGLDNMAAHLAGHGAITADLARALVAAHNKITITAVPDPMSSSPRARRCDHPACHNTPACGTPLDRGRNRYVPPDTLADHVRHRDQTCRFPGCHQPARRCDLDHRQPWNDGGTTCPCNLDTLCRTHHRLKTFTTWHAERTHNTLTWTSPLGRTYTDHPQAKPVGSANIETRAGPDDPAPF